MMNTIELSNIHNINSLITHTLMIAISEPMIVIYSTICFTIAHDVILT